MTNEPWAVHKFGGTSVANAERYRTVARIVESEPGDRKAIVVSAMSGVTDVLHALVERARTRDESYRELLAQLLERHVSTARDLLPSDVAAPVIAKITHDASDLGEILRAVWLARSCSEQLLETVAGHGEIWSAQMLGAYVGTQGLATAWLDARDVLTVVSAEIGPVIQWERSRAQLDAWLVAHPCERLVITGYVASLPDGAPTTLKRNGSDFSGAIFAALLDAPAVTIWTDVDGVLSADPRRVPEAVVLDELSYDEAMELAYFGAKVLHPRTMVPAIERNIPIWIRNTLRPHVRGTRIHRADAITRTEATRAVTGLSTVDNVALVNVEGTGMVGVPGIAQRLFDVLRQVGVSVVMISQASSEHSICFAVPEAQADRAHEAVVRAFAQPGLIERVDVTRACSVLAAVGDRMAETPGVSGTFFSALGRANVNVRAIAQGSSERNISVVIDRSEATRALRAVHAAFYLSTRTLAIGIVGPGLVGRTLLAQLDAQAPVLRERFGVELLVRAVTNSTTMLLGDPSLAPGTAVERLAREGVPMDMAKFVEHVNSVALPHAVMVDCTASDDVASQYEAWLASGLHVVTPNKRAGAGPLARYHAIERAARRRGVQWFQEATVGAGLPVIGTLRDLVRTGDRVLKIEGMLSGTLAFVFDAFANGASFSEAVREARTRGYTEPDPRDDLSGTDVARKCVILAREIGLTVDLADVHVQDLVPASLRAHGSAEDFLANLADHDAAMDALRTAAQARGEVLRYVGVVDPEHGLRAELRALPLAHPFARTRGSDNVIAFTTARYHAQPLLVQGPGAGPEVTAGGIFADLLRLAARLGGAV